MACTTCPRQLLTRRAVLAGGAAGLGAALTACQTYGGSQNAAPSTPPPAAASPAAPGAPPPQLQAVAAVNDIPVGGGRIIAEHNLVLTRPDDSTIRAFTATCTHAGCQVTDITDTINCNCHGSAFSLTDGSVTSGPANQPLAPASITVQNGQIALNQ